MQRDLTRSDDGALSPSILKRLLLPLLAVVTLFGVAACSDEDSAGPEEGASIEDLADDDGGEGEGEGEDGIGVDDDTVDFFSDPNPFVGEKVTISGEIQQIFGERSLTVGEEFHVLVVDFSNNVPVEPGMVAQISGVVGTLDIASGVVGLNEALQSAIDSGQLVIDGEFEEFTEAEFNEFAEFESDFDQQVFIIADNLDLLEVDDETEGGNDDGLSTEGDSGGENGGE